MEDADISSYRIAVFMHEKNIANLESLKMQRKGIYFSLRLCKDARKRQTLLRRRDRLEQQISELEKTIGDSQNKL